MKKLILLLITTFTLGCTHHYDDPQPVAEISKLPPATQTGANTMGCLLNGQAFLQTGYSVGVNPIIYQDGLNFGLHIQQNKNGIIKSIGVASQNQNLHDNVGVIFALGKNNNDGNSKYGIYSIDAEPPPSPNYYETTSIVTGEFKITYHNYNQAIISGTFWFDAINSNGEIIKVREGRFDMHY